MTTPPPDGPPDDVRDRPDHEAATQAAPPPDDGPRVHRDEVRDLGRLRRSVGNRRIAGVAAGIARHLDLDPLVVRVAFVVLVFFGGAGLILYAAGWLLVPEEGSERATVRLDPRSRTVALMIAGVLAALALIGDSTGDLGVPWPLVILGLVVLLVLVYRSPGSSQEPTGAARPEGAPVGAGPASYGPASYGPAPSYAVAPRPYRGPVLFWFTLAAIALATGLLGLADVAGVPTAAGAYPAVALAVIGAMLVLGAFYGRTGGLIALGLVTALVTVTASAAPDIDAGETVITPVSASQLDDTYEITVGELRVDLTRIEDLDSLDGRTLELDATLGAITVLVPPDLELDGQARATGAGSLRAFGAESSNLLDLDHDGGAGAPVLTLDAEVTFGEITVDDDEGILR